MGTRGFERNAPYRLGATLLVALSATAANSQADKDSQPELHVFWDEARAVRAPHQDNRQLAQKALKQSLALNDKINRAHQFAIKRQTDLKHHDRQKRQNKEGLRLSSAGYSPMFFKASACGDIPEGGTATRVRYAASSASTCSSEVQTATCTSGEMTPYSGTFTYTSCTESRTRYASSSTTCPTACSAQNQTRTCTEGSCGAWSGSYSYSSCTQNERTQTSSRRINQTTSSQYCCSQGFFRCWQYCTSYSTSCVTSGTKSRTCQVDLNTVPGSWTSWSPADQC